MGLLSGALKTLVWVVANLVLLNFFMPEYAIVISNAIINIFNSILQNIANGLIWLYNMIIQWLNDNFNLSLQTAQEISITTVSTIKPPSQFTLPAVIGSIGISVSVAKVLSILFGSIVIVFFNYVYFKYIIKLMG